MIGKNHRMMLDAAMRVSETGGTVLIVCGSPAVRAQLEAFIQSKGLDRDLITIQDMSEKDKQEIALRGVMDEMTPMLKQVEADREYKNERKPSKEQRREWRREQFKPQRR